MSIRIAAAFFTLLISIPGLARELPCAELLAPAAATEWLADPARAPEVDRYIHYVLSRPRAERVSHLETFDARPAHPGDADFLEKLAYFHEPTWLALTERYAMVNSGYDLLVALLPLELHMPAPLRRKIEGVIREFYATAGKLNIVPSQPYQMAPKRSLDTLISNLDHPFYFFREQRSRGLSARDAYNAYLQRLDDRIFHGVRGFGGYTGDQVLDLAREFQAAFRDWRARNPSRKPPTLFIAGSLPNGRANLQRSDIDSSLGPRDPGLEAELKAALSQKWTGRKPMALEFSFFPVMGEGHLAWNAQVNPINIFLHAETLEIWVYPPQRAIPHRLFNEGSDVQPDIYVID